MEYSKTEKSNIKSREKHGFLTITEKRGEGITEFFMTSFFMTSFL